MPRSPQTAAQAALTALAGALTDGDLDRADIALDAIERPSVVALVAAGELHVRR